MQRLGREYPNLRAAIYWCRDGKQHAMTVKLCEGIWPYAYRVALFNDLEEILATWMNAVQAVSDECSEGRVLQLFGRLYWHWEQHDKAIDYLRRAEGILEKCNDFLELGEVWTTRASICRNHNNLEESAEFAQKAYALGERLQDPDILALASGEFARIERRRRNYTRAVEWLKRAEELARQSGKPRTLSHVLYNQGRTQILFGFYADAEAPLTEALSLDIALGERRYIAQCKYSLAQIYAATGRLHAARQFATEACELLDRLGMRHQLSNVEEFLAAL